MKSLKMTEEVRQVKLHIKIRILPSRHGVQQDKNQYIASHFQ